MTESEKTGTSPINQGELERLKKIIELERERISIKDEIIKIKNEEIESLREQIDNIFNENNIDEWFDEL